MLRARSSVVSLLISLSSIFLGPEALGLGPDLAFAQSAVTGVVTDSQGAAVVRAIVRVVEDGGREVASTLTDASGRFTFASVSCRTCRIEASRTGLTTVSKPIGNGEIAISLGIAPVRDEVVVTPTLEPTPASQTGASVTVITAEDIERRGTPLVADLMRSTPSVAVVRTGQHGGVTSLFMRGGESDYTKVLLDGIPLNEPGGTYFFDRLSSDHVERIEIVRGAQSALFGSDAMSGVIQLMTKRGTGDATRPMATFDLSGGTYSTARFGGSISGRRQGWDYLGGIAYLSTDNRVPNSEFENTTVSLNAGGALSTNVQLRAIGRVETGDTGTPGRTAFGERDSDAHSDRTDWAFGTRVDHTMGTFSGRFVFSSSRTDLRSENRVNDGSYVPTFEDKVATRPSFDFPFVSHNLQTRQRLSYQGDWRLGQAAALPGEHSLTIVGDADFESGDLERFDPPTLERTQLIEASRNNFGAAVQYQWAAARASVTGGVRIDNNEHFGTEASPRILATALLSRGSGDLGETRVRFSAGKGVKAPTFLETYSPSPFSEGNPDLLPERSRSFDIGLEQRLVQDRVSVDVVYFDTKNRDQITVVTTDFSTFFGQYYNVGSTRARGMELSVRTAPSAAFRLAGGYSLVASEITESNTIEGAPPPAAFVPGRWALRRPRHSGFVEVAFTQGRFAASVLGNFVGRRTDTDQGSFAPPLNELPAYAIWRAGVRYTAHKSVTLTLDLDNLTNTDYMEPMGYLTYERTFRAGIRVRF